MLTPPLSQACLGGLSAAGVSQAYKSCTSQFTDPRLSQPSRSASQGGGWFKELPVLVTGTVHLPASPYLTLDIVSHMGAEQTGCSTLKQS